MSKHWDPRQSGWAGEWDRGRRPRARNARRRRGGRLPRSALRLALLAGLLSALGVAGLLPDAAFAPEPPPAEWSREAGETEAAHRTGGRGAPAVSLRVIDGDTFDHGGMRVRIADIDTPELRGRCAYEKALAVRAKRRLDELLHQGPIELRPAPGGRDEDRYGRKLRIVTRGGRSVGDMLVAEGLARTWTGRREPWCV